MTSKKEIIKKEIKKTSNDVLILVDKKIEFFKDVISRANDSTKGPVYIHCWNGWHQSGLLSAITLIQFCDYSNKEAIAYWERCTDGNFKGFPKVRQRISEYKINRKKN